MASQTAETPRQSAAKVRATGPGPLRTARGAGRRLAGLRAAGLRLVVDFFGAGLRRGLVLRDRVLELDLDVLLLRDPGGEDVRVAMLSTLGVGHTSPMDHRSACLGAAITPFQVKDLRGDLFLGCPNGPASVPGRRSASEES